MKHIYITAIIILFSLLGVKTEVKAINHVICSTDTCASSRITKLGDSLIIATSNSIVAFNKNEYNVIPLNWTFDTPILSTTIDKDNNVWYADMSSLYCVDQENIKTDIYPLEDILFYCYSIQTASNGDIWIGGARSFFVKESEGEIKKLLNPFDAPNTISIMSNIEEDKEGNMWMAITSYGSFSGYNIVYYDKSYNYTNVYTKSDDQVHTIQIDKDDNIWFASSEGISCMNKDGSKIVYSYDDYPEFGDDFYVASSKDEAGNLWFSSSTTLMKFNGTDFTTYTCTGYEEARSILCDGNIVWVLLKNDTLLKFQNNEFETINLSPVVAGVEDCIAEAPSTKAFVSNGVLNIENAEGINSVVVYDAMGRVITSANDNGATSTQIVLPATLKGVIMVKVNNEVLKVMAE